MRMVRSYCAVAWAQKGITAIAVISSLILANSDSQPAAAAPQPHEKRSCNAKHQHGDDGGPRWSYPAIGNNIDAQLA